MRCLQLQLLQGWVVSRAHSGIFSRCYFKQINRTNEWLMDLFCTSTVCHKLTGHIVGFRRALINLLDCSLLICDWQGFVYAYCTSWLNPGKYSGQHGLQRIKEDWAIASSHMIRRSYQVLSAQYSRISINRVIKWLFSEFEIVILEITSRHLTIPSKLLFQNDIFSGFHMMLFTGKFDLFDYFLARIDNSVLLHVQVTYFINIWSLIQLWGL